MNYEGQPKSYKFTEGPEQKYIVFSLYIKIELISGINKLV